MYTSLGHDSPSHSFTVQVGGKKPLLSVCGGCGGGGLDGIWSLHPTAISQGLGKDQCQATQTQKKSLIAQIRARAVFFPIRLSAGRYSQFKWQENRNGRHQAGDDHPHPCNYGFLQLRGTVHLP